MTDDTLIESETPIHMTKYDGSYHRRWPGRFVLRQGPLYLLAYAAGDVITKTPLVADDPAPFATRWPGDVYLWDDRWFNVARVPRDGRTWFYVNIATPASSMARRSTASTSTWMFRGLSGTNRGFSTRTNSSRTARPCGTLPALSSVRAPPWTRSSG